MLYTSDGRDVEMSVASTKAFYSQIAAGLLLSIAITDEIRGDDMADDRAELLAGIAALPTAMEAVLARRDVIATAAHQFAPSRRYWAMVGNGPNRIAAQEVRVKLSELCYKSSAADSTEDKKHIDLSSEPLIFVCAAGLSGRPPTTSPRKWRLSGAQGSADRRGRRGPVAFSSALAVLPVPTVDPRLGFILRRWPATSSGTRLRWPSMRRLADARGPGAIERAAAHPQMSGEEALVSVESALERTAASFFDLLAPGVQRPYGGVDGEQGRIALRFALGSSPLEAYQIEYGKVGTPAVVLDDLAAALTLGIEELTRPIDAIKHQAKTVTVGISRSDETLLDVALSRAVVERGSPRSPVLRLAAHLADLDPAIGDVLGHTRYRIEVWTLTAMAMPRPWSSTEAASAATSPLAPTASPTLKGTKHQVALERRCSSRPV